MRLAYFGLLLFACSNSETLPPPLGDFDGAPPIPPGTTGGDGGGGVDAADGGVLTTASNPKGIFVSSGFVYYTNFGSGGADGTVSAIPIGGGAKTDLASALASPWAISVAAGTAYFTLAPAVGTGGLSSVPITGGNVTSIQSGITGALGVATDTTNVYWTNDASGGAGALVWSVPLAGGTPKELLEFGGALSPTGLLIVATDVYVPSQGAQAAVFAGTSDGATNLTPLDTQANISYADVAVSATTVYATVDDATPNGAIVTFPRAGGPVKTLVSSLDHPQRLALDGTHLYFTDPNGGNVWVLDTTTTDPPVLFATGLFSPLPIAIADAVYIGAADSIVRLPKL